jgi:hypothetical protein
MTMDGFDDLTPPPERQLTPTQRDRLRAALPGGLPDGGASTAGTRSPGRTWLPVLAAAAVVAVVVGVSSGLGGALHRTDRTHPSAGPAPAGTTNPSTSPSASPCLGSQAGEITTPGSVTRLRENITRGPGTHCPLPPAPTCARAVQDQLPGATQVASSADLGVGFWQAGQRWVLCYHDTGETTVQHVGTLGAPVPPTRQFAFSTDIGGEVAGERPTAFVAGGPLGGGDSRITYTFPDGHHQDATYVDGADGTRWWVLRYVARSGLLADPATHWDQLPPVVVRLYGTDVSAPDVFHLDFATSGCAQANHGC